MLGEGFVAGVEKRHGLQIIAAGDRRFRAGRGNRGLSWPRWFFFPFLCGAALCSSLITDPDSALLAWPQGLTGIHDQYIRTVFRR